MSVHEGHRDRLRKNYLDSGLNAFSEINALEMLLFYAIPRRDTNELAHALIERFGDLDGVLSADVQELTKVDGIGESTAVLISMLRPLDRMAQSNKAEKMRYVSNSKELADFFRPHFLHEVEEVFLMVCLDSKNGIICCREISRGVVNGTDLSVRKILETALHYRASSVVIAHNHPGGFSLPSREDDYSTRQIRTALMNIGIRLWDHIIICDKEYISYADSKRFY